MEVQIDSSSGDGTTSWVVISRGVDRYVTEISAGCGMSICTETVAPQDASSTFSSSEYSGERSPGLKGVSAKSLPYRRAVSVTAPPEVPGVIPKDSLGEVCIRQTFEYFNANGREIKTCTTSS